MLLQDSQLRPRFRCLYVCRGRALLFDGCGDCTPGQMHTSTHIHTYLFACIQISVYPGSPLFQEALLMYWWSSHTCVYKYNNIYICINIDVCVSRVSFVPGGPVDVVVEIAYLCAYVYIYVHIDIYACTQGPLCLQDVYMYIQGLLQFRRPCRFM